MGSLARVIYITEGRGQDKRPYYLYDTFETWQEAREVAKRYKKRDKSRYYILCQEIGWLFPEKRYALYLTKVMRLFG